MEVEEAGKTREDLSPVLVAKNKATRILGVPISTCKIGIKEDHPE